MPTSGKPDELLADMGIDAQFIAEAARRLVSESRTNRRDHQEVAS
jgi:hypothetical protein